MIKKFNTKLNKRRFKIDNYKNINSFYEDNFSLSQYKFNLQDLK